MSLSNRWTGLTRFLTDPRVPLDNGATTERAMRGLALGRKNHYGSRSRRGTEVAALYYSLMDGAQALLARGRAGGPAWGPDSPAEAARAIRCGLTRRTRLCMS